MAASNPTFHPEKDQLETDATQNLLIAQRFLANQFDSRAISVNTIQFNLNQLSELVRSDQMEKAPTPDTDTSMEESVQDKLLFLENKLEFYKITSDIELEVLKEENSNLRK